jgi:hypothetical protein
MSWIIKHSPQGGKNVKGHGVSPRRRARYAEARNLALLRSIASGIGEHRPHAAVDDQTFHHLGQTDSHPDSLRVYYSSVDCQVVTNFKI